MRLWFLRVVLFAVTALPASALTKKVLIIGIDGTMPSALAVAQTPNLNALIANGCFSNRVISHPVTHSAAAWSSLFTGVWGDNHGVNDPGNSFAGNQFATYPSFYKRLEDANPALNTVCLARWSPLLTVVPNADVKLSFGSDAAITTETVNRLTTTNPDVFYMILLDVDSAGHTYGVGPTVPQYLNAIQVADGRVGQIMNALTSRATYAQEDWLVIVSTDHGQHDHPDPERSRIIFHIISGSSAARLSGWFGGAGNDADSAALTVSFVDAQGAILGTDSAGAVTPAQRGNVTSLLQRSESGVLPVATRFAEFVLTCSSTAGSNDASADNLSFILVSNPDPGFQILGYGPVTGGWEIEVISLSYRRYSLERSDDFTTWQEVVPPIPGTGGPLTLTDPDPPATRAFYRVAYRRL